MQIVFRLDVRGYGYYYNYAVRELANNRNRCKNLSRGRLRRRFFAYCLAKRVRAVRS